MPRLAVERWEQEHRQHVAEILEEIDAMYQDATDEMVRLGMSYGYMDAEKKPFRFSSSKLRSEQAAQSISAFQQKLLGIITAAMATEWAFANDKTDSWVKKLFSNPADGYMQHNLEALNAFIGRKQYGHTLSDRVWDCSKQFQRNIEWALSVGLAEGRNAANISRDVRLYLNEPDRLFRRVRDQYGNLVLSKAASGYHPGQGVYRSSYQNAMRMARTEINGAYREADHVRWQQLDFIVGIEIKTSKSHADWLRKDWLPKFKNRGVVPEEICDTMKGRYPKDFKFIGWHPNCRCYAVPILANEGTDADWWEEPQNQVSTTPKKYKDWISNNKERIEAARKDGKLPYFLLENRRYFNLRPERTAEQKKAIIDKWQARQEKYKRATTLAASILKVAKNYPEVDTSKLREFFDGYRIYNMRNEAKRVANLILEAKKDDKFLSKYIPDVREWKKQFSSAELHEVYGAVEKKIAGIKGKALKTHKYSTHLEQELADFDFEIKYVADPTKYKPGAIQYPTWKVSKAAYAKQHALVLDAIEWQNIDNVLQEALTFKTKSKPYLGLIDELKESISAGDKAKAQSIVADMQTKREALKRAADARAKKKAVSTAAFDDDCFSQERKDAAVWHKTARKADDYFHDNAVEFWPKLTDEEKEALWGYTAGSGYITEPLRAINGHYYYYESRMAETDRHIKAMTSALNKQSLKDDIWIKRDSDPWNIDYIFGIELDKYRSNPSALVGKTGLEDSFQSCGSCKETRFTCTGPKKVIMNIYCPKGTNGAYAQPWSSCGTYKQSWNGVDKANPTAGAENEVILQRGAKMRITKAEYTNGMWYIDVDVLGFDIRDFDLEKGAGGYFCKFK